jgi:hypothetical protein
MEKISSQPSDLCTWVSVSHRSHDSSEVRHSGRSESLSCQEENLPKSRTPEKIMTVHCLGHVYRLSSIQHSGVLVLMSLGEVFSEVPKSRVNLDHSWLGDTCPQISDCSEVWFQRNCWMELKNPRSPKPRSVGVPKLWRSTVQKFIGSGDL